MTDLTEKWKKGELESGFYYVYLKHLEMFDIAGHSTLSWILERGNENSIEVLFPVPTYQEYLDSEAHCVVYSEENKRLRQLLKECKANFIHRKQLLEKLEDLEKPTTDILTRINAAISESEER